MANIIPAEMPMPGFSFENCKRNAFIATQAGYKPPKVIITGPRMYCNMVRDFEISNLHAVGCNFCIQVNIFRTISF